jgi:hypothetical protein
MNRSAKQVNCSDLDLPSIIFGGHIHRHSKNTKNRGENLAAEDVNKTSANEYS